MAKDATADSPLQPFGQGPQASSPVRKFRFNADSPNIEQQTDRHRIRSCLPLSVACGDRHLDGLVADEIVSRSMMPPQARIDALHIATAALAGVQYLLTQNCTHIANAHELPRVYRLLDELGLSGMLICTPVEFLGGS